MTDSENLDIETTADVEPAGATTETATEETSKPETMTTSATSQAEAAATATAEELVDIDTLGKDLPAWTLAGVMRHQRWAPGKAVTPAVFDAALAAFEGRPLGGGR